MKLFKKLLFVLMALAIFGSSTAPLAYAQEAAEEEVVAVVEELGYDPIPALIGMRDTEEILIRMAGVLDRYDGKGHPAGCDDFAGYYTIMSLLGFSFEIEALFAPNAWVDVLEIAADATSDALRTTEPIFLLCQNGNNDSLSAHNLAAGRDGIEKSLEKLRSAIRATASRLGLDPELIPSSIAEIIDTELSPEDIEFISELLGFPVWDAELFYEDLLITGALQEELGGWLDRLISGKTVGCGEYAILMELSISPVPFLSVPDVWQALVSEHYAIINSVLDSNRELIDVCINGGNISEFMVFKARSGIANAVDRLHIVKQETARRLDITPQ